MDFLKILITGGAGYIGSHLCVELLENGFEIIVIDNFSTSTLEGLRRVKAITGKSFHVYYVDLLDKKNLRRIFRLHSIDSVIHLAGYKSVRESTSNPMKYYRNNIEGTMTLCEVMQEYNVNKLVFSSSATVYTPVEKIEPISENHPLGPTNPYGHTKQLIEEMLRDIVAANANWSISILRYFNPVGAHESGLIGENPKGIPTNLFPYLSNVVVGKLPALFIYGNDYPTPDGTGVRDYIHVVDLAKGHLYALNRISNSSGVDVYNLGTGKGYSVFELLKEFERVTGETIPYLIAPRREGDVAVCFADVRKAKVKLGWEATKGIDSMCHDAWKWQRNNPNGYGLASMQKLIKEVTEL